MIKRKDITNDPRRYYHTNDTNYVGGVIINGYQSKNISLMGNRKLINACRKNGLELFNPTGDWNGYGYERLLMHVRIETVGQMRLFNKLEKQCQPIPKPEISEEEYREQWVDKLTRWTRISKDQAIEIADAKEDYYSARLNKLIELNNRTESDKYYRLMRKLEDQGRLPKIKNKEHAHAIVSAHLRHTTSDYEFQLEAAKDLAQNGEIDSDQIRDYALSHTTYR